MEESKQTRNTCTAAPVRKGSGAITTCGIPSRVTYNEIAPETYLGIIQKSGLAARIQAPINLPHVQLPLTKSLWAGTVRWANDTLHHTATTADPGNRSRHEMWHGTAAPVPSPSILSLDAPVEVVP